MATLMLSAAGRLWDSRADTLEKCAAVVVRKSLRDELYAMAVCYRQCALELKNPPVELIMELGLDKPDPDA